MELGRRNKKAEGETLQYTDGLRRQEETRSKAPRGYAALGEEEESSFVFWRRGGGLTKGGGKGESRRREGLEPSTSRLTL